MNRLAFRPLAAAASAILSILAALSLASCGSGAVSGSPAVNDPNRITLLPGAATLYAGQPTTFQVSGGTGTYIITSSDQAVIPISGTLPRSTFTVIPSSVSADTPVTLTVRDTGNTPVATAVLTVKPGTVANALTITPTSTQGGNCAPAICSGSDAEADVLLANGATPLPGRAVRFEAVTGDFRFIASPSGSAENLQLTTTVLTDETGHARVRIRVLGNANNQTAIVRVVDVDSGASRSTSFSIAQATGTSPGFFASPGAIVFAGPNTQECASSGNAEVVIFGGTPPYNITTSSAFFTVSQSIVTTSGGSFTVFPRGGCVAEPGLPVSIVDATGRTTIVNVANVPGAIAPPTLAVSPATVTLSSCSSIATVSVAGGTGNYIVSPGSSSIFASYFNGTINISRRPFTTPPASTSVGVGSGNQVATITVNLTGGALTTCEGGALSVDTSQVFLGCGQSAVTTIRGGTGNYSAGSNVGAVTATVSGATLTITRVRPSAALGANGAQVTVRDGTSANVTVIVNGDGVPCT